MRERHAETNRRAATFTLWLVLGAILAVAGLPAKGAANDVSIRSFFGDFEGRTLFPMGETRNRELFVSIRADGAFGFNVFWETMIYHSGAQPVSRSQEVRFEPALRRGLYRGQAISGIDSDPEAASPADGAPHIWARINERTLTVNVLTVADNGDYVVQTYERTLTEDGLDLVFTRVRNGAVERQIKGQLKRRSG